MGNCISGGAIEVSEEDRRRHREAEKSLKEVRIQCSPLAFQCIYAYLPSLVPSNTNDAVLSGKAKDGLTGQGT